MTGWILGSLEALGLAAAAAALASVACAFLLGRVVSIASAARRADVAVVLGLVPAVAGSATWLAVMLPASLAVAGIRPDHCDLHLHHPHLCALHAGGAYAPLAVLGAAAFLVTTGRAIGLLAMQDNARRALSTLEGLGRVETGGAFPIIRVPGSPWICLAAGGWRRRVVMSASIATHLDRRQVGAALAHELAHLERRDPLVRMLLAWGGLFSLPTCARRAQQAFTEAAEEASDALAARTVGAVVLAGSLVSMARLTRPVPPATCMAFGGSSLERRVDALLHGPLHVHPALSGWGASVLAGGAGIAVVLGADPIHHAIETLLQLLG